MVVKKILIVVCALISLHIHPAWKPGTVNITEVRNLSDDYVFMVNNEEGSGRIIVPFNAANPTTPTGGMWIPHKGGTHQFFMVATKAGRLKFSDANFGTLEIANNQLLNKGTANEHYLFNEANPQNKDAFKKLEGKQTQLLRDKAYRLEVKEDGSFELQQI